MEEGQQRNQKSGQMIDEKRDRGRPTFYFGPLSICSNIIIIIIIIRIDTHINVVSGQSVSVIDTWWIYNLSRQWDSQWLLLELLLILQEWFAPEGQNPETLIRQRNSKWIKAWIKDWKYFNKTCASIGMTDCWKSTSNGKTECRQAIVINFFSSPPSAYKQ